MSAGVLIYTTNKAHTQRKRQEGKRDPTGAQRSNSLLYIIIINYNINTYVCTYIIYTIS